MIYNSLLKISSKHQIKLYELYISSNLKKQSKQMFAHLSLIFYKRLIESFVNRKQTFRID